MPKRPKVKRVGVRNADRALQVLRDAAARAGVPLADYLGQVLQGAARVVEATRVS